MDDKKQETKEEITLPEVNIAEPPTSTSGPTEDMTRSPSAFPTPAIPTLTKPSALAGQPTTNPAPFPPPPIPETLTGAPDVPAHPLNPQVAALKAIFPDYDDAILYVLHIAAD
jgi:hypothetical protein